VVKQTAQAHHGMNSRAAFQFVIKNKVCTILVGLF